MKLLTCLIDGKEQVCVLSRNEQTVYPVRELGLTVPSMNALIQSNSPEIRRLLETAETSCPGIPYSSVGKCAPIPHPVGNVICLGENYFQHAEESYRFQKIDFHGEQPNAVYFDKKVHRALGDGETINGHFDFVTKLDYECELAVILGREASHISEEEANTCIFGYSIANDVSARDIQFRHKQYYLGKSLDTFFAMGPVIVTADEVPYPPSLPIRCYVNNQLRQGSVTDQVFFNIGHIISELSRGMTLPAGTILITGTPAGAGMGMDPPSFLQHGDVVTCEIQGIGRITNPIE